MKKTTLAKKAPAKKVAPKKAATKKVVAKKPAPKPASRPQRVIDTNDQHGPMHIPSHKPAPAYAGMSQNKWAGNPPRHNIPIPKK